MNPLVALQVSNGSGNPDTSTIQYSSYDLFKLFIVNLFMQGENT